MNDLLELVELYGAYREAKSKTGDDIMKLENSRLTIRLPHSLVQLIDMRVGAKELQKKIKNELDEIRKKQQMKNYSNY